MKTRALLIVYRALLSVMLVVAGGCAGPTQTTQKPKPDKKPKDKPKPKKKTMPKPDALGPDVQTTLDNALEAAKDGRPREAGRALEHYTDHPEYGFLACYNLGVVLLQTGRPDKAEKYFKKALKKRPSFSPALRNLASIYLRQGRTSALKRLADRLIDRLDDPSDVRAIKLQVTLQREAYRETIRRAKSILRNDETNAYAMSAMAEANLYLGRHELAKTILSRLKTLLEDEGDPSRLMPKVYYLFGTVHMKTDRRKPATQAFDNALELDPVMPEAHNNLGILYYEARKFDEALSHLQKALQQYPDFKRAHINIANVFKEMKKPAEAERYLKKVLRVDPRYAKAYFNLGSLYLDSEFPNKSNMKRLRDAIEAFNRYKQLAEGKQSAKINRADKYIDEANKAIELEKQRQRLMQKSGG